ncbi:MAG: hypothetical protein JNK67_10160 [Alphaproteobacteria bacterium]|nr:hypothetical protein [Alphaproteobacteria bacterium]
MGLKLASLALDACAAVDSMRRRRDAMRAAVLLTASATARMVRDMAPVLSIARRRRVRSARCGGVEA